MRLDELPLFETLFTGVAQGEGARGGAGGGDSAGMTGSDPAAAGKARLWMLRALRDGEEVCARCRGCGGDTRRALGICTEFSSS